MWNVCLRLLQSTNKFGTLCCRCLYIQFHKYIDISPMTAMIMTIAIPLPQTNTKNILTHNILWRSFVLRSFRSFFLTHSLCDFFLVLHNFVSCNRMVFNLKHICAYRSVFAVNALYVLYGLSFVCRSFLHHLFLFPSHTGYVLNIFWYGC